MKWHWIGGTLARVDLFLLLEYKRPDDPVLLPRFATVDRCPGCGKFNEQQILDIGFDVSRVFRLPQDILTWPNDLPQTVVNHRFRDVCLRNNVKGVDFIPCGTRKSGGLLYILWAVDRSPCHEPVERWDRGSPLKPSHTPYYTCHVCGRPDQVIGYPHRAALELTDEFTISVPSIPTEPLGGLDFRFFCSDAVRTVFKLEKLKGCSFAEMERREKLSAKFQEFHARRGGRGTDE